MPLLRRRRPDPPEWASFFDADDWHEFSELIRYEAGRRRWADDLALGFVVHEGRTMGLTNLAQQCHAAPRTDWVEIVARHFAVLDEGGAVEFRGPEEARAALRARLVDDDFTGGRDHPLAEWRIAEDLRLVLAYDLPTRVVVPPREDVLEWGSEAELFDLALTQTRAETGLELERFDYDEQDRVLSIWALTGDSFFTASHVIWADELDPPAPEGGVLVAVPNRHTVLAHPIRDLAVVSAVTLMHGAARGAWEQGPGSLSPHLYWLHERELERLQIDGRDESVTFVPTDEFVEVLNRLD
jgi:hypothetical protein